MCTIVHGDSWRHWWSGRVDAFQDQLQTHPESRVLFVFSREIRSHNTYEYQYLMYIITRVKQTPLRFSGHLRSLVFHSFPSQAHWEAWHSPPWSQGHLRLATSAVSRRCPGPSLTTCDTRPGKSKFLGPRSIPGKSCTQGQVRWEGQ